MKNVKISEHHSSSEIILATNQRILPKIRKKQLIKCLVIKANGDSVRLHSRDITQAKLNEKGRCIPEKMIFVPFSIQWVTRLQMKKFQMRRGYNGHLLRCVRGH